MGDALKELSEISLKLQSRDVCVLLHWLRGEEFFLRRQEILRLLLYPKVHYHIPYSRPD